MDEALRQAQDYDLWLRIAAQFEIHFMDIVTGTYCIHSRNISKNAVGLTSHVITILNKADTLFPDHVRNINKRRKKERFYKLYSSLAYCHFCRHEQRQARKYFVEALRHRKSAISIYPYIMATLLNRRAIEGIRALKGRFVPFG